MTITAKYQEPEHNFVRAVLQAGDCLGSLSVPAEFHHEDIHIEAGPDTPFVIPCDGKHPAYLALKAMEEAGEIVIEEADPVAEPPAPVVVVSALDFYRRLTEAEGAKVEAAIQAQPFLKRQIFLSAQTFRSDAPGDEWELLESLANGLFGPERAAELLAPSQA
jgi:hypothetical protein